MNIRLEEEKDWKEVEHLTREAFWNVYCPGCSEHLVLHHLRKDKCFVKELDYIIEEGGKIVANIVYAIGHVTGKDGRDTEVLLFGPVSVDPACQGKGYGQAIISYTLEKASKLGYPAVVITGNPDYYKKYGFGPAASRQIYYNGMDPEEDAPYFMVKILDEEKAKGLEGIYKDPEVYAVDPEELEKFDKQFPPKKKEVREGQLNS